MRRVYCLVMLLMGLVWGCNERAPSSPDAQESEFAPQEIVEVVEDIEEPQWPENAVLTIEMGDDSGVTLMWPPAIDNRAVNAYRIYQSGIEIAHLPSSQTTWSVNELMMRNDQVFSVRADDAAGNGSILLESMVDTIDQDAPTWSSHATLRAIENWSSLLLIL